MASSPTRRSGGGGGSRGGGWNTHRLISTAVFLGLVAAVLFLLSERHHRLYAMEVSGGELRVVRGRMLPFGFVAFEPSDTFLANAYAPLPCATEMPAEFRETTFAERDDLDRALFRVLQGWVEQHLASQDPRRLGDAVRLVHRAALLPGIEDAQRTQLRELQGRLAWFEGRLRLEEASSALRDGAARLQQASQGGNRHAREAGELYERVSPLVEELARALREPLRAAGAANPAAPSTGAGPAAPPSASPAAPPGAGTPENPAAPSSAPADD